MRPSIASCTSQSVIHPFSNASCYGHTHTHTEYSRLLALFFLSGPSALPRVCTTVWSSQTFINHVGWFFFHHRFRRVKYKIPARIVGSSSSRGEKVMQRHIANMIVLPRFAPTYSTCIPRLSNDKSTGSALRIRGASKLAFMELKRTDNLFLVVSSSRRQQQLVLRWEKSNTRSC
jgi:hypothetical protein